MNQHEFVLCYARDLAQLQPFFLPPDPKTLKYYKYQDEKYATRGPYRLQPLATTSMDDRPNLRFAIHTPEGTEIWPEKQWQWSEDRVRRALEDGDLVLNRKGSKYSVSYKQYLRGETGSERPSKPVSVIDSHYTQHGTYESIALFGLDDKLDFVHSRTSLATDPGGRLRGGSSVHGPFRRDAAPGTSGHHGRARRFAMSGTRST